MLLNQFNIVGLKELNYGTSMILFNVWKKLFRGKDGGKLILK